ncbi:MAG: dipeptide ABC transporter ATP-binding protein [Spirochaetes bacterium]|nr:dipeptide ABC transporter ATP-binding protein [Spirochaetota bacterium]MBU1082029.1 dipeptide ABC transporter ATP-binding protein [Spirochaetota bacterium]
MSALLEVEGLQKHFPVRSGVFNRITGAIRVVEGVSFSVDKGKTFALVGESGCGKTTAGRTILRLHEPTGGSVRLAGVDLAALEGEGLRTARRDMQMVFQNPFGSLNPRMKVGKLLEEPLVVHGIASGKRAQEMVDAMMEKVGLAAEFGRRYPHQFSGGQRQRIAIARALMCSPKLVIADEPVSALDVSIQSQILNLLVDLRTELGLTYVFISHDLNVVRRISDAIGVMYLGRLVERAETGALYERPLHPYSEALLSAVPSLEPSKRKERIILSGDVPNPASPPPGCVFHPRCPKAMEVCRRSVPPDKEPSPGRLVACHLY